ncbi:MAG: hypothetical protein HRT68_11755, partial [Flavobacteriaceae bacterium]|nr:hypothetical protein [Flavobacteriaceae bacterium]
MVLIERRTFAPIFKDIIFCAMQRSFLVKIFTVVLLTVSSVSFAGGETNHEGEKTKEQRTQEVKEYIPHHLLDSYDFSLYSYTAENGEHIY